MQLQKAFTKYWLLFFCAALLSCNNDSTEKTKARVDKVKSDSFYLPVPTGWTKELISFPIDFAPGIVYTGVEDLRFAKGWGDVGNEEHWCYAFAWWLNGSPLINAEVLQKNLTEYYTGLVGRNVAERKIPADKVVPTVATIRKMVTLKGDKESYTGIIQMLDYHSANPITLNCMIHVKSCGVKDHTAILFQISPKPLDHAVWKQLNALNDGFTCSD